MKKDFLVIGQGLAGSLLGWELMNRGYTLEVWDKNTPKTSSKKAAGLYNPITGRKLVKTWLADELFSGIELFYTNLEQVFHSRFLNSLPIYRPFHSFEEQNDWLAKYMDGSFLPYISEITDTLDLPNLNDPFGGLHLKTCGYLDLPKMLTAFRALFQEKGVLHDKVVDSSTADLTAHFEKIIYCDGSNFVENQLWKDLPFKPVRGEIIDVHCDLPTDQIYNRGVFIIPKEGAFRVGSTYDHDNLSFDPQPSGIEQLKRRLTKLYSGNFELIRANAGVRPATHDRKPYIGWHPKNKVIGIFNGFGTKGVSLVPYFSKLFVDSIEGKAEIHPDTNVSRVY